MSILYTHIHKKNKKKILKPKQLLLILLGVSFYGAGTRDLEVAKRYAGGKMSLFCFEF